MSRNAARMVAAGLTAGGFALLILLSLQLNPGQFLILGLAIGCLCAATYVNTATATLPQRDVTKERESD